MIELMTVVIIAVILAAVAITTYGGYRRRTHALEGQQNVYLIASAQVAYKAEYGVYADVAASNPSGTSCGAKKDAWEEDADWQELGWRPQNKWVYCQYTTKGGDDTNGSIPAWAATLVTANAYGWYTIEATCDLDCVDSTKTTYRLVSTRMDLIKSDEYARNEHSCEDLYAQVGQK